MLGSCFFIFWGGTGRCYFYFMGTIRLCPLLNLISTSYNKMVPKSYKPLWNSMYKAYFMVEWVTPNSLFQSQWLLFHIRMKWVDNHILIPWKIQSNIMSKNTGWWTTWKQVLMVIACDTTDKSQVLQGHDIILKSVTLGLCHHNVKGIPSKGARQSLVLMTVAKNKLLSLFKIMDPTTL